MINLETAKPADIYDFAHNLFYSYRAKDMSFEEIATICVEKFYNTFRDENGERYFALVRIYRVTKSEDLPQDVIEHLGDAYQENENWLALMGTIGDEPNWCDRRQSKYHQAVAINTKMSRMFRVVIRELNLDIINLEHDGVTADVDVTEESTVKFFFVADAIKSNAIPDKEQFVYPYGIQSVIGLGSAFISNSSFVALYFCKQALSKERAKTFAEKANFLATLLATYDSPNRLWAK